MTETSRLGLLFVTLLLAFTIPLDVGSADHDGAVLTTTAPDGIWVNESLLINGSTTLPAQDASWVLYDVTDPYSEWEILRTGEFFSTVTPVDEGIWIWSISIDTQGLNCTCWLEVSQPNGLERIFLNRIIFIGEGPHNPVLSPVHDQSIIVDEPVLLSTHGILAQGDLDDTQLLLEWCSAPQGACDGDLMNQEINVTWDGDEGTFPIDADSLNLSDGSYLFTYHLRDATLLESPLVSLIVHVDHTDPIATLSAPLSVNESELLMIDGSDSRDGVWGNALQANWFITSPDGELRIAEQSETDGLVLSLYPEQAGIWSIKVDVVDMVGRRASQEITVLVENIIPESAFTINGLAGDLITNYTFIEGDEMILDGSSSIDTESDMGTLTYLWTVDGISSGDMSTIDLSELGIGLHEVELSVTDDDGTTSTKMILFSVEEKSAEDDKALNTSAIIVFALLALGLGLFMTKRLMGNQSSASMPKWHKSSGIPDDELDVAGSDTGMWTDPKSKGKD